MVRITITQDDGSVLHTMSVNVQVDDIVSAMDQIAKSTRGVLTKPGHEQTMSVVHSSDISEIDTHEEVYDDDDDHDATRSTSTDTVDFGSDSCASMYDLNSVESTKYDSSFSSDDESCEEKTPDDVECDEEELKTTSSMAFHFNDASEQLHPNLTSHDDNEEIVANMKHRLGVLSFVDCDPTMNDDRNNRSYFCGEAALPKFLGA